MKALRILCLALLLLTLTTSCTGSRLKVVTSINVLEDLGPASWRRGGSGPVPDHWPGNPHTLRCAEPNAALAEADPGGHPRAGPGALGRRCVIGSLGRQVPVLKWARP